eukprot:CAMPEP_0175619760 /NCGR_PEP_ID=MMETSP0096-20121207/67575_1 /TAXON_ID=311494 /ORGANISM="Alexandrium monilatum, Strain CCMP3105" /LENGTH=36 /DNA_ID= /DNA_START= /DNA_END= /DNA_ORIENTATION=
MAATWAVPRARASGSNHSRPGPAGGRPACAQVTCAA